MFLVGIEPQTVAWQSITLPLSHASTTCVYLIMIILADCRLHIHVLLRLVSWLCLTSNRQRDDLETAPPFTVPCEGRGGQLLYLTARGIEPRVVVWQPITQLLHHASSMLYIKKIQQTTFF